MSHRKQRISDRINQKESEISDIHLGRFAAERSRGLRFLRSMCEGRDLTRESLIILGQVFSTISGVRFPRDFTRRRTLIIKWFNDHLEKLEPIRTLVEMELVDAR